MRTRYQEQTGQLKLVSAVKEPVGRCKPIDIGGGLTSVTHCQTGNQQWNPEADTTIIETVSANYSAVVATNGMLGVRTEIPADSNWGVVLIAPDSIAPDDSLQIGAVFAPSGDLLGVGITTDSIGFTLDIIREDGVVTGLVYSIGTTAGDTLYLELSAEELACGGDLNPCLRTLTSYGASMTSQCWDLAAEALGTGLVGLGAAADLALTFTPYGVLARGFGYTVATLRVYKAMRAARTGMNGAALLRNAFYGSVTGIAGLRNAYTTGKQFAATCM